VWPLLLNKNLTKHVSATYYFHITGEEIEDFGLQIEQGCCVFIDSIPEKYNVKISAEPRGLIDLLTKNSDLDGAIKRRELLVEGSLKLMFYFENYFSGDTEGAEAPQIGYAVTENERELQQGIWRKPRWVLGLQASPSKQKGGTEVVYSKLIEGMTEAGATINSTYLAELNIQNCKGCLSCWRGEKRCVIKNDAMQEFYDT